MENALQFLHHITPLSDRETDLFRQHLRYKKADKGSFLVQSGAVQHDLYFIESGIQMSYYEAKNDVQVMAFTYFPGITAVPDSFLMQQPSPCCLTCLTDSSLYALSYDALQELFRQSHTIERLFRKMNEYVLCGLLQRHVELHTLTIEERFLAFARRSPHLLHAVPHKYIASYLGMNPTNFSKLYNKVRF